MLTSNEAPYYVVFSILLSSRYSPQHAVLEHPESVFLS
jgi:hypothetical protein